jgi:hypothetical protein
MTAIFMVLLTLILGKANDIDLAGEIKWVGLAGCRLGVVGRRGNQQPATHNPQPTTAD